MRCLPPQLVDVFSDATHGVNARFRPSADGEKSSNSMRRQLLEDQAGSKADASDDAWLHQELHDDWPESESDADSDKRSPAWIKQARASLGHDQNNESSTASNSSSSSNSKPGSDAGSSQGSSSSGNDKSQDVPDSKNEKSGSSSSKATAKDKAGTPASSGSSNSTSGGQSKDAATDNESAKPPKPQHAAGGRATILTHLWREGCEHGAAPVLVLKNMKSDTCVKDKRYGLCAYT